MTTVRIMKKYAGVLFLALALALTVVILPANEAHAASITLKPIYSSDSLSQQVAKSKKVKKVGTYSVKVKNGMGIIRFVAPKKKTYSFTFSGLNSSNAKDVVCITGFCKVKLPSSYTYKKVKTQEGTRPLAIIVTSSLADGKSVVFDGYSYQRLAERTAKLKVGKKKSIYIVVNVRDVNDNSTPSNFSLKIS